MSTSGRLLSTRQVEKVWGRMDLPTPFVAQGDQPIGEIWYEPPPELDKLLAKYLFTKEKLSVQVHPSSAQAREGEAGKEEFWLVLDAQPDAKLAIGFKEEMDAASMRAAALDGSIEQFLEWHPVKAGDTFHLPPGTVHAIGPGLSLVEIQQNSDTTFRLYDYGRPRELHLERGVQVAQGTPYAKQHSGRIETGSSCLIDAEHFRIDRVVDAPSPELATHYTQPHLVMPIEGQVVLGDLVIEAGACAACFDYSALDFSQAKITLLTHPK